ncbi:MAG: methionyl-tRNA formyltransferase [Patescibacteria group bacterium]
MKKLRVVYFGTPDFSARFLELILNDKELLVEVVGVVTQEDKKVGRKQLLTKSPVKLVAEKYNIPVISHPEFISGSHKMLNQVQHDSAIDLGLLFAYGNILPKEILDIPKFGFWNVHPSLLPKYRGPSPIAAPLIEGKTETGVTIIKMDDQMDHGPIIVQKQVYIFPVWRRDQLTDHLVEIGFTLFKECFMRYAEDLAKVPLQTQDHSKATYSKKLTRQDGYVPLNVILAPASPELQRGENAGIGVRDDKGMKLFNLFRGLYPWPGIWTRVKINDKEQRLKITKMHWENDQLVIKKVQLEGKKEVDFEIFNKAYRMVKV